MKLWTSISYFYNFSKVNTFMLHFLWWSKYWVVRIEEFWEIKKCLWHATVKVWQRSDYRAHDKYIQQSLKYSWIHFWGVFPSYTNHFLVERNERLSSKQIIFFLSHMTDLCKPFKNLYLCASALVCWLAICCPLFTIMVYSCLTAGGHADSV